MKIPETTLGALIWLPFVLIQILFMALEGTMEHKPDGKDK